MIGPMGAVRGRAAAAAALGCLLVGPPAAPAAEGLAAAAADEHLWFVVPPARSPGPIILRHHARASGGPHYTRGLELGRSPNDVPEAMAAWGERLWLVFDPRPGLGATDVRRQAFTVRIRLNPAFGGWFYDPPDRLVVLSALEGRGVLAGFVGTDQGPVALLLPRASRRGRRLTGPDELQTAALLALRGPEWTPLELPEDFGAAPTARLAAGGDDGRLLALLESDPARAQRTSVWWRDRQGAWELSEIDLDLSSVVALSRVGPVIAVASRAPGTAQIEVAYLRRDGLVPLCRFTPGGNAWAVQGLHDGPRIVGLSAAGEPSLGRIDPVSGAVSLPVVMSSQRLEAGRIWHLPLLVAVTVVAVLMVFLLRPSSTATAALPPGTMALAPMARLLAALVDLAASGLVVMLLMGIEPACLLKLPLWTPDLAEALPGLLMIGLTACHSTLSEVLSSRTLGKALVGGWVTTAEGARPRPGALVLRNLAKLVVLLVPVLVVVGLFSPHWQGLDDQVARTFVVRRGGTAQESDDDR